jgi:hypothetical protein
VADRRVLCQGSLQPIAELDTSRHPDSGLCSHCRSWQPIYTPDMGVPNWHSTEHYTTSTRLERATTRRKRRDA